MKKLKNKDLQRINIEAFKSAEKTPITIVLDNVRSALNVGSVFRTSDAFLIEKIYLCGITATPPHKDIHKTALGATDNIAWEYVENTLVVVKKLQEEGTSVWAIEQTENATLLNSFKPKPKTKHAFVLGNEVRGVSQQVVSACGQALEIPQYGTKHSLNISVATGIIVWDYFTKI